MLATVLQVHWPQVWLLIAETIVIGLFVLGLFRLREWFGITMLCVLLGVLQPIQALLTFGFYLEVIDGVFLPPGSVVLFSAGLLAVLLVYLREDASAVRTVIYSLVAANLLASGLFVSIGWHESYATIALEQLGGVLNREVRALAGGTLMLALDALIVIPIYERCSRLLPRATFWRMYLTLGTVLAVDSVGFSLLAFSGTSLFMDVLIIGMFGKLAVTVIYAGMLVLYLRYAEPAARLVGTGGTRNADNVFSALSYRQRYELQRAVAEDALEQVAGLHEVLLDATPDALIALDGNACVVDANRSAQVVLDRPAEALLAQPLNEIIEGMAGAIELAISGAAAGNPQPTPGGASAPLEATCRTRAGETRHLEAWVTPVKAGHGPVRTLLALRDVSDRQQLFEHRLHTSRMESLGRLAGGVAHDFNNLLMVIMSAATMIEEERTDDDVRARMIREAAERGARLTHQLLTFARNETMAPDIIDVNETLQALRDILERVTGDDIHVELDLAADTPAVWISKDQLEQVVINLTSNARDAMPGGGTIRIATEKLVRDSTGALGQTGNFASISVADRGPGISKANLSRIFDPFFTTKEVGEGTGLGLSMAFGIAEQAGGKLEVESEIDTGSVFRIVLPQTARKVPLPAPAYAERPPARLAGKHILVVDDDANVARVVVDILASAGYRVSTASSAKAALDKLTTGTELLDLLLTDIVMPDMRGDQLAKQLRDRAVAIPVIFMTGHATGVAVGMLSLAGYPLLHKPFQAAELLKLVGQILHSADRSNQPSANASKR